MTGSKQGNDERFSLCVCSSEPVIGSMTPDFAYVLRGRAVSEFSHTIPGLFAFCLPVGLVMFWSSQRLVKRPAISLLPSVSRLRMGRVSAPVSLLPPSRLLIVVLSLLVGALKHLTWDAFTH